MVLFLWLYVAYFNFFFYFQAVVVINDQLPAATQRITENAASNGLTVEVTTEDVSVLLHKRTFDFM